MRNSFRKSFWAATVALTLLASALPIPPVTPARAQEAGCVSWQLVWVTPPADPPGETVGALVPPTFYTGENPERASSTPAMPTLPPGSTAEWQCVSADAVLGSAQTSQMGGSMALCAQAAKLAAKFGGFTALDTVLNWKANIQTAVLTNIVDYLQKNILEGTFGKVDIKNLPQSILNAAGDFVGGQFDALIGNPMKSVVSDKLKAIEEEAKKKLAELTQKLLGDIAKKTLGALNVASPEVPVKAEGVESKLKAVEKKQDQQIAEQKIAEVNADTRAKCAELLKTTNETIKKALLYQLSTQIVDWVQTGKTPQFIKQPGKFLENTGRLALDRFISRVAPRLCEPFRLSVELQIPSVRREDNPFYEQITCTLDKVVANVENFYQDFRQGGWIAYNEMLKPQNNYYGASLAVIDEAARQQATAAENARLEQARGFVPVKQCTQWVKYVPFSAPTGGVFDRISVQGVGDFMVADDQAPEENGGTGPVDADGKVVSGFMQEPQTGPLNKGVRLWKGLSSFWECEADEITSPATVAAGLAEKASQTDLDNLAATQDVSMFLQTIEDSIINKLVKSGVKGLKDLLPRILP